MAAEWSRDEDRQPGKALVRPQPELTAKGYQWTWLIEVGWPAPVKVQVYIRDCGGQLLIDHGRVFPPPADEDGA